MQGHNVLYICNYAANYSGNFIASLAALARKVDKDNTVYYLFPEEARNRAWMKECGISPDKVYFCSFTGKSLFSTCNRLASELGKKTIVHTHFVSGTLFLAVKLCFRNIMCHYHMSVPECTSFSTKIKRIINNIVYANVVVIGVSEAVTADLRKYFKFHKCECVKNAISFADLEKASLKKSVHHIDSNQFSVLIHGSDFMRKGVDLAIDAVQKLNLEGLACKLFITSHEVNSAQRMAEELCGSSRNIEAINVVEDVKTLYDSADVFISPSRREAFGYAVAEAAYSKCQVIASNIPGQNTMRDIPGIIWVKTEDSADLSAAIAQAMERKNKGSAESVKTEQRRYVAENYGIEKWIARMLSVYDQYFA